MRFLVLTLLFSFPAGHSRLSAQTEPDVDRAAVFLRDSQSADGTYGPSAQAIRTTSLVLQALAGSYRHYSDSDGPFMRRASLALERALGPDGGVAAKTSKARLEATAWVILGLQASGPRQHRPTIRFARDFLALHSTADDPHADPRTTALLWRAGVPGLKAPDGVPEQPDTIEWALATRGQDSSLRAALVKSMNRLTRSAAGQALGGDRLQLPALVRAMARVAPPPAADAVGSWRQQMTGSLMARRQPSGAFSLGGEPVEDTALAMLALEAASRPVSTGETTGSPLAARPTGTTPPANTGDHPAPIVIPSDLDERYRQGARKSLAFLASSQEGGKFGFGPYKDAGITALCLSAVIRTSHKLDQPEPDWVGEGLAYLASLSHPDGSIYQEGLKVYVTSAAVMALVTSGRDTYRPVIEKARDYLMAVQADEGEGYSSEADWGYGGIGYGGDLRPDLSNTQFGLEALRAAGLPADDAAFQRALIFLQRCQNDQEGGGGMAVTTEKGTIVPGRDGGATYAPGASKAGLVEIGEGRMVARSYGSMTYALLKSYVFAGLTKDDPRVKAAYEWIHKHYTLDENPGFDTSRNPDAGHQGLFYYYFTMAKALDAFATDTIPDAAGKPRPWRRELAAKLLSMQGENGAWLNKRSERWLEGNPVLATAYALVTLDYCFE